MCAATTRGSRAVVFVQLSPTMSPIVSWSLKEPGWSILVHGGAGAVPPERRAVHEAGCLTSAMRAAEILRGGGSSVDAVQQAVESLEDDPAFNAGTGASLNSSGELELDAAIMSGKDLRAGAVCALAPFLHPIAIARAVLEDATHVLYAAEGAKRFACAHGFSPANAGTMITEAARARWQDMQKVGGVSGWAGGTVGAVACDVHGHVAAATSTGGLVNKAPGRVGDTPILGAGTYADDETGACSTTGHGEAFMRLVLAKHATDLLGTTKELGISARNSIELLERRVGGHGGLILATHTGLAWARNTETMSWAAVHEHGGTQSGCGP